MNRDELLMVVRLLMQVAAGFFIARGIGDQALWEAGIGFAVMVAGYIASHRSRAALRAKALSSEAALGMLKESMPRQ